MCVCARGHARQETGWNKVLWAGICLPSPSTLCMLCRKGWSSQKLFPLWDGARQFLLAFGQGVAPFFCPGGAAVDRWLGSFQFRPPCWECVWGSPGGEKKAIWLWEGALVLGCGVLAPAWSLHQESRTILGAWRGAIGASSESDQIRPQRQSDLLCVILTCSFLINSLCFYPNRNMTEWPNYQEWSWGERIRPVLM